MKTVCNADECTGCMACADICPKRAITVCDELLNYQAVINEEKCVSCDLCHRICQSNHQPEFREPIAWYEGWANNPDIREKASSGGAATELALTFIQSGGVVYSCTFTDGEFVFCQAVSEADIWKFVGSKYVKSNPSGVYMAIKHDLAAGKRVMLIALPCQVAALRNIVGDKDLLYTVDLICHGTPSPWVLDKYLKDSGYDLKQCREINFRLKTSFQLSQEQKRLGSPVTGDYYTMTFLDSTIYTENCYSCKYARKERVSDITLGDSWGSQLSDETQAKGVSLMLCQTDRGHELLRNADIKLHKVDIDRAIQYNHQLRHPSSKTAWRESFFQGLLHGKTYDQMALKYYPQRYVKDTIKKLLYSVTNRGGG